MVSTLCTRLLYEGIKLGIGNFIYAKIKVCSRASSRFHLDRWKIVDSVAFEKCQFSNFFFRFQALCAREFGMKELS